MEETYTKVKDDLIHDCMRAEFEMKLLRQINWNDDMEKIDKIVDPLMRQYFREADALAAYYNPDYEKFNPDDKLTEEDMKIQKFNCLNGLLTYLLKDFTTQMLRNAPGLREIDTQLTQKIKEYFMLCEKVGNYYNVEECDHECNGDCENCPNE